MEAKWQFSAQGDVIFLTAEMAGDSWSLERKSKALHFWWLKGIFVKKKKKLCSTALQVCQSVHPTSMPSLAWGEFQEEPTLVSFPHKFLQLGGHLTI